MKKFLNEFEDHISAILLGLMVILIFLQIVFRFVLNLPLRWTEEAARYTMIILIYLSACSGVKAEKHIRIEAIQNALPPRLAFIYWLVGHIVWYLFNGYMVIYGYNMASRILKTGQVSPVLHVPMGLLYMIIPVSFAIMDIRVVQKVVQKIRNGFGKAEEVIEQ